MEIERLAAQVGERLQQRGWYLVIAESCTGGAVAQAITSIVGSSSWFDRGFVTYSNAAKQDMLDVSWKTLEIEGAVSKRTVLEMVKGALVYSQAQVGIAVSGIAGPSGGTPDKPIGTVWIAYAFPNKIYACHYLFDGNRCHIRAQSVKQSLQELLQGF